MRSALGSLWGVAALVLLNACGGGSPGGSNGGDNTGVGGGAGTSVLDGGPGGSNARGGSAGSAGTIIIGNPDSGPACVPPTCAELNANCGAVTDRRCGGVVDCGSCATGEICGAGGPNVCGSGMSNVDGGGTCVAKTCADLGADCGPASDTCGGLLQCGTCSTGTCGGGGTPNVCGTGGGDGGGTCVARSCADQNLFCGPAGDGCGGTLDCGTCTGNATCGGGGTAGLCGSPVCTPRTCADQSVQCGPAGDGCGGVLSCGTCASPKTCGGGGTAGVCGCTGLCAQVPTCSGTATTTITGKVYDPAGNNPLYNVLVYVPNEPNDPALRSFSQGVTCDQCGASAAGKPLVTTFTSTDGSFTLSNVPTGSSVPLVIQLGRWRRIFNVNVSNSCAANPVADKTLKMPSDHTEGDIPQIAMVTGNVDEIECVFRKMGLKDSEFTNPGGGGRIHFYRGTDGSGNSSVTTPTWGNVTCTRASDCAPSGGNCNNGQCRCGTVSPNIGNCNTAGGQICGGNARCQRQTGTTTTNYPGQYINPSTPLEGALFQNDTNGVPVINQYDMTILACEGADLNRTSAELNALHDYTKAGGRVYASHYSYSWLHTNGDFTGTAQWNVDQQEGKTTGTTPTDGYIDLVSNPRGNAFQAWLEAVGVSAAGSNKVPVLVVRHDTDGVIAPTQQWLYRQRPTAGGFTPMPLHFTFNAPPSETAANQCGRVLFSDFHVHDASDNYNKVFPSACDTTAMNAQEKLLEFMIFDLGSCVTPYTPVCTPRTCGDQGVQCGPAGDGCGNALDCGTCPSDQICGGAGPGKCGTPTCTARSCDDQGIQCGPAGDGCGHALDCGTCAQGLTCGGGGRAGVCGNQICTPLTCTSQGIQCGPAGDGCGNALDCGSCPTGQTCGGGGPGKCGAPQCTPRSCAMQDIQCGPAGDGCGNLLDCGVCPTGDTCGFNAPGKCGHSQIN